jgi:peptide/nickel transport system permease protein
MTNEIKNTPPETELDAQRQELYARYEELSSTGISYYEEEKAHIDPRTGKSLEDIYGASQWRLMWRKFIRNKAALGGGIVILLFYLVAIFGGFIAPYGKDTRFTKDLYRPPDRIYFTFQEGNLFILEKTSEYDENLKRVYTTNYEKRIPVRFFVHGEPYKLLGFIETDIHLYGADEGMIAIVGADRQGRDMFSRIIFGSQVSLTIGLVGVGLSLILGTILGIVSGYYSGWVDNLIQRLIELIRSFPSIPLWMALSAAIPLTWSVTQTYFAISIILSLLGWTWLARQLRGQVLAIRNQDFVMASKLAGASDRWIIFRHLVPATLGQIVVVSTLQMPSMILAETALSWLGLGLRPPVVSWGVLIQESQNYQSLALYPWVFIPAVAVAICILAFSYLGDGLRDSVDPYTI